MASWVCDLGTLQPWDLGFSLHITSYWELWIPAKIMYGHYLNSEGLEQSLWLSCTCHTHSDPQWCSPSCSAPCRTEPFTNPPNSKSIDFQSNPPGFLICISWTSCLLKLSLFALVFNQSWFWAMNMIRFSYQEGMKIWRWFTSILEWGRSDLP